MPGGRSDAATMSKTIRSAGQRALCLAIADLRKTAGLSQMALAERLHCHQSLVARIESGERRIDVIELIVLARAIGASPEDLLAKIEPEVPPDHRI